jgi:hypothetical protein
MKVIFPEAGKLTLSMKVIFPEAGKLKCFYSFLLIPRNQEITEDENGKPRRK